MLACASNRTTTVSNIIKYKAASIYLFLYHKLRMYMYELVHEHVIYKVLIVRKGSVVFVGMLSMQISPSNLFLSLDNSNLSHGVLPFVCGILLCSLRFITYGVT